MKGFTNTSPATDCVKIINCYAGIMPVSPNFRSNTAIFSAFNNNTVTRMITSKINYMGPTINLFKAKSSCNGKTTTKIRSG